MSMIEWLFRDRRTGDFVIAQPPNLAASVVTAAAVVRWLFPDDGAGRIAGPVSRAALVWWALGELLRGVNPARRLLGAGALTLLAARAIR